MVRGNTRCKWDSVIPFSKIWPNFNRIIKDNGAILLFSAQPFTSSLVMSNLKMFRYEWIWQKTLPTGHLNAKKMPMKAHENILVFYKHLPTYNPQMTHGHKRKTYFLNYVRTSDGDSCYGDEVRNTFYDSSDRYPIDIQVFSNSDQTNKIHLTQKPVDLYEYMIKTYTNKGELVLDCCAGSMTMAVAALHTERRFICIEMDGEIFKDGEKRVEEEVRKQNK